MGWISPPESAKADFSSYKDIEGMDPLQVPLWKFLYQGLHNTWLRRVAYGRESFVLPFDNIGTTVFVAELVSQLRTPQCGFGQTGYLSLSLHRIHFVKAAPFTESIL